MEGWFKKPTKLELEYGIIKSELERVVTLYKNNSWDSSKFKGFNPLQFSCNLTGKCQEFGYYSYTNR